jgi:hypothetical protein
MFKEMCKVTETDCFDSWKLSKSHLALEKKQRQSNTSFARKIARAWFRNSYTDTEFNASRLLVDNLRK